MQNSNATNAARSSRPPDTYPPLPPPRKIGRLAFRANENPFCLCAIDNPWFNRRYRNVAISWKNWETLTNLEIFNFRLNLGKDWRILVQVFFYTKYQYYDYNKIHSKFRNSFFIEKERKGNLNNVVLITFRIIFRIKSSFLCWSSLREKKSKLFWKIRNFETLSISRKRGTRIFFHRLLFENWISRRINSLLEIFQS